MAGFVPDEYATFGTPLATPNTPAFKALNSPSLFGTLPPVRHQSALPPKFDHTDMIEVE